ncbi:hexose transporter-like protein [Cucurbitaria berberidis CBS 394.84]|uniref:Hexose transporter-like protein n=1 Tax=Cucurbitaria berberidis CBS 394.84 TaxID=1168544 RepID=A0A9P4LBZ4_9PLEO|nr:hexose transporter-like protein [Cucurbitaria berberidis CBS 394.84]KAF1850131.1 hexose transporter-like protein [Cucurbitaria berberidis CBS 394.84]
MAPVGAAAAARQAAPVLTRIVEQDTVPWYRKRNLRRLYLLLLPTCIGIEMTSGFDSQMINTVQIAPSWQAYFNHPRGALLGIISSAYNLGAICALPLVPYINDKYGRRWAIFIGSLIMVVGSLVQALSVNAGMYVFARWILGFGIPFCIIAGSALMGELAYPKERPIMTSLFNALWFVGSLIAAGTSYGTQTIKSDWAWRIPCLLQAGPSIVQMIFIFMIPESPRFLISKDRREEAYHTLITFHAEGDTSSHFAAAEMAQIEHTIRIELENSQRSWREMITVPGLRKRVIIGSFLGLFTQWSGNTLLSYYLNDLLRLIGYSDPQFVGKLNVGQNSWNLVSAVCISLLVRRFPRRKMYLICASSLLCCYVAWTIAVKTYMKTKRAEPARLVIAIIFIYQACYNIGYNALTYTFLVELFPFTQRAKGITIFQFFGRSAAFFTTFVNPIGLHAIGWKWLTTYCCWLAFEIVFIYLMFPETYGRTLEELAFLFEDRALAEEATRNVEKQMDYAARRFSRMDERMSWEMDVVIPNKDGNSRDRGGRVEVRDMRRGDWWED